MSAELNGRVLENFEEAFTTTSGGCRRTCECGREFYNPDGGWSWDDGELEALEKSDATALEYAVGEVYFEGKEYVNACDCWHPRAKQIIAFINGHARGIADFLSLEKKRKQNEANRSPVVEEESK